MHSNVAQKCLLKKKKKNDKHSLQNHPPTFHLFSDSLWLGILIPVFVQLKIVVIVFCCAKRFEIVNCFGFVVIITEDFFLTKKMEDYCASKQ